MTNSTSSKLILIAGPYRSGTGDDPDLMARNLELLEAGDLAGVVREVGLEALRREGQVAQALESLDQRAQDLEAAALGIDADIGRRGPVAGDPPDSVDAQ